MAECGNGGEGDEETIRRGLCSFSERSHKLSSVNERHGGEKTGFSTEKTPEEVLSKQPL